MIVKIGHPNRRVVKASAVVNSYREYCTLFFTIKVSIENSPKDFIIYADIYLKLLAVRTMIGLVRIRI